MSTREIYIGGPATANVGLEVYPAVPFDASANAFKEVTPSAHKGPAQFGLTRVLDFGKDDTLKHYVAKQDADGTPVAQDDVLGAILLPANVLLYGLHVAVENPVSGVTLTPSLRESGALFPAIAGGTAVAGEVAAPTASGGTVGSWVTDGVMDLSGATFSNTPDILDLTITALPAGGFGDLRVSITPLVSSFKHGQY